MYTILLTFGFFLLGMKKVCDCETPCDTLQKRLDKQNAAKSISVDR